MNKLVGHLTSIGFFNALVIFLASSLVACSSSGSATAFYGLFPLNAQSAIEGNSPESIGVSLVRLPGYLENSSVVSRSTEQRLFISGRHAWAESLDRAATRAIVGNLNQLLPNSEVLGYPWDVRTKPRYALRIDLVQFDGVRGGSVAIQGRWSLYDLQDKLEAKSGFINESVSLTSRDYQSYVAALNKLLGEFSTSVAADLVD